MRSQRCCRSLHMFYTLSCRLEQAQREHQEGNLTRCIAILSRAITLQPRNPELFKRRAEAYVSQQHYHSAIINFKKTISLSPSEETILTPRMATIHYLHGQSLYQEGKFEEALEAFSKSSEFCPEEREYTMRRCGLAA